MHKTIKIHSALTILICIVIFGISSAQSNSFVIRTNAGVASSSDIVNGYYFSFDLGIPITKYFELSPTFTGSSMKPKTFASFNWNGGNSFPSTGVPVGGPDNERFDGDVYNSIGCVLYFKPLELFNRKENAKGELLIGGGYSYDSYTRTYAIYDISPDGYKLTHFHHKAVSNFSPIFAKVSYNRYFNERAFYGVVASLNDFDGDGALFLGIQLGAKL